eukprot:gene9881-10892_t
MEERRKENPIEEPKTVFKKELINKLLQMHIKEDAKMKISDEGLKMMAEFLRLFVEEGISRSEIQANSEGVTKVDVEHLEKILPQLLLDF